MGQPITSMVALEEAISTLENRQRELEEEISNGFNLLREEFKPSNIIKKIFNDLFGSSDTRNSMLKEAMAIGLGFVSRKLLVPSSSGSMRRIFGTLLQLGVMGLVRMKGGAIAGGGLQLLHRLIGNDKDNGELLR